MSSAVAPSPPAQHSRLWYVVTIGIVVVVILGALFGAVHLYSQYAHTLGPLPTRQHTADKAAPARSEDPKATAGDGTDTPKKVGGDKSHTKATTTPGL